MRGVGAIRHKMKQIQFRYLKKVLGEGLALTPSNCAHNRAFHHPTVAVAGGRQVGVCVCPEQDGDLLCDAEWGGEERARMCPFFTASATKDELKREFVDFLSTAEIPAIAQQYPDLAALMWVLQEDETDRDVDIVVESDVGKSYQVRLLNRDLVVHGDQKLYAHLKEISDELEQNQIVRDNPSPKSWGQLFSSWWRDVTARWLP